MKKTIGNPVSWSASVIGSAGRHIAHETRSIRGDPAAAIPEVRPIAISDLRDALRRGVADLATFRSDVLFLALVYPIIGLLLSRMAFRLDLVHLIFPMVSGFALLGPVAAVVLYQMSRRRERGQSARWADGFAILRSPSLGPIVVLGAALFAAFLAWIYAAGLIYNLTLGPAAPASVPTFLHEVFTTSQGWTMVVLGTCVGFVFSALVLVTSMLSFPLLVDRDVGVRVAVQTSVRMARCNPVATAVWGLIVASSLVIGAVPMLLGLVVVVPVLGHATWHLYRRAVVQEPAQSDKKN